MNLPSRAATGWHGPVPRQPDSESGSELPRRERKVLPGSLGGAAPVGPLHRAANPPYGGAMAAMVDIWRLALTQHIADLGPTKP